MTPASPATRYRRLRTIALIIVAILATPFLLVAMIARLNRETER